MSSPDQLRLPVNPLGDGPEHTRPVGWTEEQDEAVDLLVDVEGLPYGEAIEQVFGKATSAQIAPGQGGFAEAKPATPKVVDRAAAERDFERLDGSGLALQIIRRKAGLDE